MSLAADRCLGIALMGLAAFTAVNALSLEVPFSYDPVGPKAFPLGLSILLGLLSLVLVIRPGENGHWPDKRLGLRLIGVLVLLQRDSGENSESMLSPDRVAFVDAVSGSAALCIESQRLLARQKQLLDAFIQLIAGAIDAKSPYTGGHCQRVPEITLMLARAAADSERPEFRDYNPSDEDWEALHIAAWLHDCGKVITPVHVMDKATKLETIWDRLALIRTRIEVLKRDQLLAAVGEDRAPAAGKAQTVELRRQSSGREMAHRVQ